MGIRITQQLIEVWGGLPPEYFLTAHDLEVFGQTPANWFLTEFDVEVFGQTPSSFLLTEYDVEVFGSTIAALSFTPSGGLLFGGSADVTPPPASYTGTGGLTFGGSADATSSGGLDYQISGTGGLTLSGTAPFCIGIIPSGGLTFGGTAEPYRIGLAGEGGLILDGSALVSLNVHYMPTGGMTFSGTSSTTLGGTFQAGQAVFDNGFKFRKLVTIPAGKASADLSNFPVLVRVTIDDQPIAYKFGGNGGLALSNDANFVSSNWRPSASSGLTFGGSTLTVVGGNTLVVQEALTVTPSGGLSLSGLCPARYGLPRSDFSFEARCDHTALAFDVDQFDPISGTLTAWVKVPTLLSKEDNLLYCYYGGSSQTSLATSTWTNGFEAVYHCNNYDDVTSHNLDGTAADETSLGTAPQPTNLGGKIGDALNYDGNDWLETSPDNINVNDDITIETWVRPSQALNGRLVILSRGLTDLEDGFGCQILLGLDENQRPWAKVQTTDGTWQTTEVIGESSLTIGSWAHVAAVWTHGQSLKLYLNGVEDGSTEASDGGLVPYSGGNQIGRLDAGQYYRGDLDELRLSRAARLADWIKTTYRTADDSSFAIVGDREHALHLWGCPSLYVTRLGIEGSGGLTFSGTAPAAKTEYKASGIGGVTLSGSAPIHQSFTASGGLTLSDSAPSRIAGYKASGSGGLSLSSSAPFTVGYKTTGNDGLELSSSAPVKRGYVLTASGQLVIYGTSSAAYVSKHQATANGGLTFSGSSQPGRLVWGGLTLSGSAKIGRRHSTSGGLTFGGSVNFAASRTYTPSGGLNLTSSAPANITSLVMTTSGGLSLSGSTQPSRTIGGGLSLSGSATVKANVTETTSGGLTLASSAPVTIQKRYVPSSGLTFRGSANIGFNHLTSGGLALSGSAKIGRAMIGSGDLVLGNSAIVKLSARLPSSGGLNLSGQAILSTWYVRGDGGLALSNSAIATTPSFRLSGSGGLVVSRGGVPTDFGGTISLSPVFAGSVELEPSLDGSITTAGVFAGDVTL